MNIFVEVKVTPDQEFLELLKTAVTVFTVSTGVATPPPEECQNSVEQKAAPAKKGQPVAASAEKKKPQKPSPLTMEVVRAKLAALSQAGKQAEVKALITKYGAEKLSDIPKDKYPDLIKDAEEI